MIRQLREHGTEQKSTYQETTTHIIQTFVHMYNHEER